MIHFEELWEKCEKMHEQISHDSSTEDIINSLSLKLNLLSTIDNKKEIAKEDLDQAKSRLLGEILFSLTALSLKYNVNVAEALNISLTQNSINFYAEKHSH